MLDSAVFKRLAHNDTGAAPGHQGGIVIPKAIAKFFPPLLGKISKANPTIDRRLQADLMVDGSYVGTADTRYQYQTWGGKRSPERRLTDNLGPIRNAATAGDIALFLKDLEDEDRIQIHLVRKHSELFRQIDAATGERNWGLFDPSLPPVSVEELTDAENYLDEEASRDPEIFRSQKDVVESRTKRLARNRAFRRKILDQYKNCCAFTGHTYESPRGGFGLDAAHIVPVNKLGSDHPANGISLAKDIHWAFDRGLIGVGDNRRIIVPTKVSAIPGNSFLASLHDKKISEAKEGRLCASRDAFEWHRKHILIP